MENTSENKAKFFAQYWMQPVWTNNSEGQINWAFFENWIHYRDISYLPLKTLSQITDEDAIEVYDKSSDYYFDVLRSKGYALPWMGVSVEQQIKNGWIKLIEQ